MSNITISVFMSYLVENRARNLPPDALAEVFDRLIWCMSDNGEEISNERRNWLSGDDLFKVEIALAMKETFPCNTRDEMLSKIESIIRKWPGLQNRCNMILSEWDKQLKK